MIFNKTQLAKDGVQNRSKKKEGTKSLKKKRGCKIAQLAKDREKCN